MTTHSRTMLTQWHCQHVPHATSEQACSHGSAVPDAAISVRRNQALVSQVQRFLGLVTAIQQALVTISTDGPRERWPLADECCLCCNHAHYRETHRLRTECDN